MLQYDDPQNGEKPDFEQTLKAIREATDTWLPATIFYGLSGLNETQVELFRPIWADTDAEVRTKIIQRMVEISETDFEMDYQPISLIAIADSSPSVREASINLLWEDETVEVLDQMIEIAINDPSIRVRARALTELGRFILMGELGKLDHQRTQDARDTALRIVKDRTQPSLVRRRALEAIANCTNDQVSALIREAYYGDDHQMRVGAVFAMGRTYDKQWQEVILEELEADDDELRFEAARASGELEIKESIPLLARLAAQNDFEIREIAIWALGEIGGTEAIRILSLIAEVAEEENDDEILEAVDEALGNASLVGGDLPFMLDVEEDDATNISSD